MNIKMLVPIIAFPLLFVSCRNQKEATLPNVTGKQGELLLVMDKYLWNSEYGDFFRNMASIPYEPLPRNEPMFELINIPSNSFTKIFKTHRNIIISKISGQQNEHKLSVRKDVWARPQLVLHVTGPEDTTTLNYLRENRSNILALLKKNEIERIQYNYRKIRDKGMDLKLRGKHHVSIVIPAGFSLDVDSSDFVWISHEIADMTMGILIYHYPYTDPETFTKKYLVKKRNQFMKKYVPGPSPGSYMTTEELYPVRFREFTRHEEYFARIDGLWKTEKAFMGGAFISISTLDEKRNRVVAAEGFVYAPRIDKRNYMMQAEAILGTFQVVE